MKRIIPFFLLLFMISAAACKKDKKDHPLPLINGTWELRSSLNAGSTSMHSPGNDTLIVINGDGTCKWQWGDASRSMTGTYRIEKKEENNQVVFIEDRWGAIGQVFFYYMRNDGRELTLERPPGSSYTDGYKYEKIK